jgi:hypothetical protein
MWRDDDVRPAGWSRDAQAARACPNRMLDLNLLLKTL